MACDYSQTMVLPIFYIILFTTFRTINSDDESQFVRLYISGGESALETFNNIFLETRAEIISQYHEWTEGPVILPRKSQTPNHDILLFSDTIRDEIWIFDESENKPSVLIENSGNCKLARTDCDEVAEPGPNGLTIDLIQNNLLICQHGNRAISKLPLDKMSNIPIAKDFEVIANNFEMPYPRRFNSPNDIAIHPKHSGRLFFTDPTYGLMKKSDIGDGLYLHERRDLPFNGVFEINDYTKESIVKIVDDGLIRPNGIAISPDGSMLYVSESCTGDLDRTCFQGMVKFHQYQINLENRTDPPKKIGSITFELEGVGAADGLKIHKYTGLIVSSCPSGLCIVKPLEVGNGAPILENSGTRLIAHIKLGDKPTKVSNVAFGQNYMYLTGEKSIWRIKLSLANFEHLSVRKYEEL